MAGPLERGSTVCFHFFSMKKRLEEVVMKVKKTKKEVKEFKKRKEKEYHIGFFFASSS